MFFLNIFKTVKQIMCAKINRLNKNIEYVLNQMLIINIQRKMF